MDAIEVEFPREPADVTKKWITTALGFGGDNEVSDIELEQFGEEQGASAVVCRARITWKHPSELPDSIVLKFASAKAEYRDYAKSMGTYLKEVRFYQNFDDGVGLPIPSVHFAEIDEYSDQFLIVMEDLSEARMASWFSESVGDVEIALEALAGIRARFWGDETLGSHKWLGHADDVAQSNQYRDLLKKLLPPARVSFSSLLSDYSWSVLDAWLENWDAIRMATSEGVKTLVHREADMRQMFFPTSKINRFVLFDWQSPELGWGAMDACRMIVTSLSLAARREHEASLVRLYARHLKENGVEDVSEETLWTQIKLSLLMNVLAHMFSLLWVETAETEVWRREDLRTLGAALEDWMLLDVIGRYSSPSADAK